MNNRKIADVIQSFQGATTNADERKTMEKIIWFKLDIFGVSQDTTEAIDESVQVAKISSTDDDHYESGSWMA